VSDATHLLVQAERCFRLARGSAGPKLAEELEALGRAFREEARELGGGELPLTLSHYQHRARGRPEPSRRP